MFNKLILGGYLVNDILMKYTAQRDCGRGIEVRCLIQRKTRTSYESRRDTSS